MQVPPLFTQCRDHGAEVDKTGLNVFHDVFADVFLVGQFVEIGEFLTATGYSSHSLDFRCGMGGRIVGRRVEDVPVVDWPVV